MSNNGSAGGETERLRFVAGSGTQNAYFSNVNVGIGYTSPAEKLSVNGSILISNNTYFKAYNSVGTAVPLFRLNSSNHIEIINGNSTNGDIIFKDASDTNMTIKGDTGNVGIGTSSPLGVLNVIVPTYSSRDTDAQHTIIANSGDAGKGLRIGYDNSGHKAYVNVLDPGVAWGDLIMQDGAGKVGIGTASPDTKLDVTSSGANGIVLNTDTSDSGNSARLFFDGSSNSCIFQQGADLSFRTGATAGSSSGTERVSINTNGMQIHSGSLGVGVGPNSNDGRITTSSHIRANNGTGGCSLTANDGGGNASITFNHESQVPEQNGNSGRIHVNTDTTSNATMAFELASNVTSGATTTTTDIFNIRADKKMAIGTTTFTSPVTLKVNKDNGTYTDWESIAAFQSKRSADSENEAGIFINSLGDALGGQISSNWYWDDNTGARGNTGRSSGIFGIANSTTTNSEFYWQTTPHNSNTLTTRMELDGATSTLHVDGDVVAFSTTTSDVRLKDNVKTIDNGLDKIMQLRGVEFDWNATSRKGQHDIGLIAQEVEEVIPEIVREKEFKVGEFTNNKQTFKTIDYEKLVGVLIEAVKEQQEQINELKEKLNG
jgi:hypothetical protein